MAITFIYMVNKEKRLMGQIISTSNIKNRLEIVFFFNIIKPLFNLPIILIRMTQTLDFSDKNVPNNVRSINMGIFFPKGEKPSISWKFYNCRILMPKELSQFIYKYVPWEMREQDIKPLDKRPPPPNLRTIRTI
jgi:hypothetical protein